VFNVLLQMLDDGRLTDGKGRTVDFTQTLVLMTSNMRHEDQVRGYFRPEFINRLDEIITFRALAPEHIRQIVDVQLRRLAKHLAEQEITLDVSDAAKDQLAKEGYDPEYGARPLKRAIQRRVQTPLADAILGGKVQAGDTAVVDFRDGEFYIEGHSHTPDAEFAHS
jgi:ATP-dependent Clp protease ATP-binding subunit ClpB